MRQISRPICDEAANGATESWWWSGELQLEIYRWQKTWGQPRLAN
jgi:hypothetical protein